MPASNLETLPPGTYYWQATYTGRRSKKASTSECGAEETVEEAPKPTKLTTSLRGGGDSGAAITVPKEARSATARSRAGKRAQATGKVNYKIYSDNESRTS